MPRELHPENLIPTNKRTKAEVRKNSRKGGIKSGEVRREKKLMSQIYAEILAKSNNLAGTGMSLNDVVERLLVTGNVQMIKEIREATEGNKVNHSGTTAQVVISDKKTVKEVVSKLWD